MFVSRNIRCGIASVALAIGIMGTAPALAQTAQATGWQTYHDPATGFSMRFPGAWQMIPGGDSSHVSFVDAAHSTMISPLAQLSRTAPSQVFAAARAPLARARMIAGHVALDVTHPFVPGATPPGQQGAAPRQQSREVLIPVANGDGTTITYQVIMTQGMDATGRLIPAAATASTLFDTMLASITLPTGHVAPMAVAATSTTCATACSGGSQLELRRHLGFVHREPGCLAAQFWLRAVWRTRRQQQRGDPRPVGRRPGRLRRPHWRLWRHQLWELSRARR